MEYWLTFDGKKSAEDKSEKKKAQGAILLTSEQERELIRASLRQNIELA